MTPPAPTHPFAEARELMAALGLQQGVILVIGPHSPDLEEDLKANGYRYEHVSGSQPTEESVDTGSWRSSLLPLHELVKNAVQIAGESFVSAILALGVDSSEYHPAELLQGIGEIASEVGYPPVILSADNIASALNLTSLVQGKFLPVTRAEHRRQSTLTDARLGDLLSAYGFREMLRSDVPSMHFATDADETNTPGVRSSPLNQIVQHYRAQSDDFGPIHQFLRAYTVSPTSSSLSISPETTAPFLSVVVRTQGQREGALRDALASLAAQRESDFETVLVVHNSDTSVWRSVQQLVNTFDPVFAGRVRIYQCDRPGRAAPLNLGLEKASGAYIAFLDDDDVAFSDWVGVFKEAAVTRPGCVVRTLSTDQLFRQRDGAPDHYWPESAFYSDRQSHFDLLTHLHHNETPICSFALPMNTIRAFRLSFDERLPVVEDWDFFLRVAMLAGVEDRPVVTALYRRWAGSGSSIHSHSASSWTMAREMVLEKLDSHPILFPRGSARRLAEAAGQLAELDPLRSHVQFLEEQLEHHQHALTENQELIEKLDGDVERLENHVQAIGTSKFWKMTKPLRMVYGIVRS